MAFLLFNFSLWGTPGALENKKSQKATIKKPVLPGSFTFRDCFAHILTDAPNIA